MGTMRERSPGTWELVVSTGWDPTKGRYGRVIRTVRTSSRREVKAALARLEVDAAGGHVGTADPTVAQLASAPSQPQREQHPPTAAQVQKLIDAATHTDPMFGLYVRVVAATGMRRSEACGLRWSDVDLQARRLIVARSHISLPGASG